MSRVKSKLANSMYSIAGSTSTGRQYLRLSTVGMLASIIAAYIYFNNIGNLVLLFPAISVNAICIAFCVYYGFAKREISAPPSYGFSVRMRTYYGKDAIIVVITQSTLPVLLIIGMVAATILHH